MTEIVCVEDRSDVAAELRKAGEILRRGGLVAFPTETVYGIAVAATIPEAVRRLYEIKGRPPNKPMTVMVADVGDVRARCPRIPPAAERLMDRFWPGPLTLVLRDVSGHMTGFRLPSNPLARGLVRMAGVPLLVPSANRSANPPATTAEGVLREFPTDLDLVIDGGPSEGGVPSTVVQVTDEGMDVLRQGAIPEARILGILGSTRTVVLFVCTGNTDRSPLAAALFRRRLSERLGCPEADLESRGFVVESAGLDAKEGRPASAALKRLASEWPGGALDLAHHASRKLTEEILEGATHVFVMERGQADEILAFFPNRTRDVRLLDPEGHDVKDPAGGSALAFRRLAGRLDAAAALIAAALAKTSAS